MINSIYLLKYIMSMNINSIMNSWLSSIHWEQAKQYTCIRKALNIKKIIITESICENIELEVCIYIYIYC